MKIPNNFDGKKFAEKFSLNKSAFFIDAEGELICPSIPDLSADDVADCLVDEWKSIRADRDRLLAACDWTQMPDAALTGDELVIWQDYRQALRNIPQDFDTPDDVVFPEAPNG
jgi:hypothetical protein